MKNILGEEVKPRKLTFEWQYPHLHIFANGNWAATVSPNGWQGDIMNINHKLGEPVLTGVHFLQSLSFSEMAAIIQEFNKNMDGREMALVVSQMAKIKKISIGAAVDLITHRKIPCFNNPRDI